MMKAERRAARGEPTRSDVKFGRVAAVAAVWGAVLIPAALLIGCNLLFVNGSIDRMALALVASAVAAGVALMVIGRRVSGRVQNPAGTTESDAIRLVAEASGSPVADRRSAA